MQRSDGDCISDDDDEILLGFPRAIRRLDLDGVPDDEDQCPEKTIEGMRTIQEHQTVSRIISDRIQSPRNIFSRMQTNDGKWGSITANKGTPVSAKAFIKSSD